MIATLRASSMARVLRLSLCAAGASPAAALARVVMEPPGAPDAGVARLSWRVPDACWMRSFNSRRILPRPPAEGERLGGLERKWTWRRTRREANGWGVLPCGHIGPI